MSTEDRKWCPGWDSNPHARRHRNLNPACLPVPTPGQTPRHYMRQWRWCPEPDSNRHDLAVKGFSYPLQLSLLQPCAAAFGVWTFSSPYRAAARDHAARLRREPSSLYTSPAASVAGFSSGLPPPCRAEVSPNLTPFTRGFPTRVLKTLKSLVSTCFTIRASDQASHAACDPARGSRLPCHRRMAAHITRRARRPQCVLCMAEYLRSSSLSLSSSARR